LADHAHGPRVDGIVAEINDNVKSGPRVLPSEITATDRDIAHDSCLLLVGPIAGVAFEPED
jgi:hypothetical protein